jgi:two-component system chemotaxis response regulator CheY
LIDQAIPEKKSTHVLIVAGQGETRKQLQGFLAKAKITQISFAETTPQILEIMSSKQVNLVLSEWDLWGVSILDTIQKAQNSEALKHIPFLMITAADQKQKASGAACAGICEYILKPFSADTLAEKLQDVLEKWANGGPGSRVVKVSESQRDEVTTFLLSAPKKAAALVKSVNVSEYSEISASVLQIHEAAEKLGFKNIVALTISVNSAVESKKSRNDIKKLVVALETALRAIRTEFV